MTSTPDGTSSTPGPSSPGPGSLIVATPELKDPNFAGTVVLLLEHGPLGSVGVVLNRPSELLVDDALSGGPMDDSSGWDDVVSMPGVVHVGGPVRPNAVLALARVQEVTDSDRWEAVFADVGVVRLGDGPLPTVGKITALRIFAGYAGWGEDQLAGELESGAWFVIDAAPDDPFSPDADRLWRDVLRRQGGMFTTVTEDPLLN